MQRNLGVLLERLEPFGSGKLFPLVCDPSVLQRCVNRTRFDRLAQRSNGAIRPGRLFRTVRISLVVPRAAFAHRFELVARAKAISDRHAALAGHIGAVEPGWPSHLSLPAKSIFGTCSVGSPNDVDVAAVAPDADSALLLSCLPGDG